MRQGLHDLLNHCTVQLCTVQPSDKTWGTGFFVAPQLILTCAHVVKSAWQHHGLVEVYWHWQQQRLGHASIIKYFDDPYPDLALLQNISIQMHPCAYLDTGIDDDEQFYGYGYVDDKPNGTPVTFRYEGIRYESMATAGVQYPLIKFKHGQAQKGMSGGPLLNKRTGYVCGVIKRTRDPRTDLGGTGIPVQTVFQVLPELRNLQYAFHQHDRRWQDLRRVSTLTKGQMHLQMGKEALMRGEYSLAYKELEVSLREITEQELPWEAAQARYFLTLALLGGMPPSMQGPSILYTIEELLSSAISLYRSASYLKALALLKRNVFLHTAFTSKMREVYNLLRQSEYLRWTEQDEENFQVFQQCQPHLEYEEYE